MGIKGWYLENNSSEESSYTDFTYTDFTQMNESRPAPARTVRKVRKPAIKKVKAQTKKKSTKGKAIRNIATALLLVSVSVSGTWYYLTNLKDSDDPVKDLFIEAGLGDFADNVFSNEEPEKKSESERESSDKSYKKNTGRSADGASKDVYDIAENIYQSLKCDNDVDTAREIFNWVHSNVYYMPLTTSLSYEEAAIRGFTRKNGDCYVYFACSKMLLDCAGIPNLMVERYPVITNGHYWNLVQLDGEWYHCDATEFKDHPDMYFMCTDEEIDDGHHDFDSSLYPERASYASSYWWGEPAGQPGMGYGPNSPYVDGDYDADEAWYYDDDEDDYYADYADYEGYFEDDGDVEAYTDWE